jgi:hypothetical protein
MNRIATVQWVGKARAAISRAKHTINVEILVIYCEATVKSKKKLN